ncbi:DUF6438 domain-containing protein [Echinicola shivajiensis]|uniref:DUF6438 domain-containing protein n=1 Tax=Echinicola shivajiensis TaxID=1035916 RepID=UPI001BFC86FB|nr:DUF6438 domain-containing protein [Echinicola shivajiensis]
MKYFPLIFVIIFSCSKKKNTELAISLEGDWMEVPLKTGWIYDWSGLKFKGDTVYMISDFGNLVNGPYSIVENRIVTEEFEGPSEIEIQNLTRDSLIIGRNGVITKYYSRRLEHDKDLKFNSISIAAYRCLDLCWEFDYKLDSEGFEVFNGKYNTKTYGIKSGRINEKLLDEIDSLFKWTNIKELDPNMVPIETDGWRIDFEVNYNENKSITFSTTEFVIPYRFKPIFQAIKKHLRDERLM